MTDLVIHRQDGTEMVRRNVRGDVDRVAFAIMASPRVRYVTVVRRCSECGR